MADGQQTSMTDAAGSTNGWRAMAREYVIVVLGVLTALIVDQAADDWSWRGKKAAALAALEDEMTGDIGVQLYWRAAIQDCLDQRYAALAESVAHGSPKDIAERLPTIEFPNRSYGRSAFDAAIASGVPDRLEPRRWAAIRILYGPVDNIDGRTTAERPLMASLRAYDPSLGPPDPVTRREMLRAIAQLRELNQTINQSGRWILSLLQADGVRLQDVPLGTETAQVQARFVDCWTPFAPADRDFEHWTYPNVFKS